MKKNGHGGARLLPRCPRLHHRFLRSHKRLCEAERAGEYTELKEATEPLAVPLTERLIFGGDDIYALLH